MTSRAITTQVPVAFGDWVDLGPGPMEITMPSSGNRVLLAANAETIPENFEGGVSTLGYGNGTAHFTGPEHVWAKVMGAADNGIRNFLTVVTEETEYDDVPEQPTAVPMNTENTAYSAGNAVGGLLTFQNALGAKAGTLKTISLRCKSVVADGFKLYLFSRVPEHSTWTDKQNPDIEVGDLDALMGVYTLEPADSGLGNMTVYRLNAIEDEIFSQDGNLYGILVALGSPTFHTTNDISIGLGVKQRGE